FWPTATAVVSRHEGLNLVAGLAPDEADGNHRCSATGSGVSWRTVLDSLSLEPGEAGLRVRVAGSANRCATRHSPHRGDDRWLAPWLRWIRRGVDFCTCVQPGTRPTCRHRDQQRDGNACCLPAVAGGGASSRATNRFADQRCDLRCYAG